MVTQTQSIIIEMHNTGIGVIIELYDADYQHLRSIVVDDTAADKMLDQLFDRYDVLKVIEHD